MADSKGPKIDLPEELVAELEEGTQAPAESSEGKQEEKETASPASGDSPEAGGEASEPGLEDVRRERDEFKDRYLRLAADLENTKRRMLKEREDLFNYGNEALIKELLETVDNLERALEHGRGSEEGVDADTMLEGVGLTHRGLMRVLERSGVQVVEAAGKPFDPQVHEAVQQIESEEHPPGTVVEVYQKGYLLKDRLLRPALVGVSRAGEGRSD